MISYFSTVSVIYKIGIKELAPANVMEPYISADPRKVVAFDNKNGDPIPKQTAASPAVTCRSMFILICLVPYVHSYMLSPDIVLSD